MIRNRTIIVFFTILIISITIVFIFAVIYIVPQNLDKQLSIENIELKSQIATLQQLATTEAVNSRNEYQLIVKTAIWQQEIFTATLTAQEKVIEDNLASSAKVIKTATALYGTTIAIADKADMVAKTATAMAPKLVKLKNGQSASLFTDALSITLDGYTSILSKQKVNFSVYSPESVEKTFQGQEQDSSVFYEGKHKYSIVVTGISEEDKILTVSLVVTQW